MPEVVSKLELIEQLKNLGVKEAGIVIVHIAFSKVKPIEDGPMG